MGSNKAMKKTYLVVYDYGTGGLWGFVKANSESEILDKFPELKVVSERPNWMDDKLYSEIKTKNYFDIHNPTGWLLQVERDRGK